MVAHSTTCIYSARFDLDGRAQASKRASVSILRSVLRSGVGWYYHIASRLQHNFVCRRMDFRCSSGHSLLGVNLPNVFPKEAVIIGVEPTVATPLLVESERECGARP